MDTKYVKIFLDSCHESKKITELMPELPNGMKPRHIHVIDTIYILSQEKEYVKVSDISKALKVTKPSITKLINELEGMKVVVKNSQQGDNRITTLTLTSLGEKYYETYVDKYHKWLAELFTDISEEDILVTSETVHKIHELMKKKECFDGEFI